MEKKKQQLPPDEQRCSQADNKGWRCKNFRMNHGDDDNSVPKSKYCEKHYKYYVKKRKEKRSGEETKEANDEEDDTSHIQGGSANVETKTKKKNLPPNEHRCGRTGSGGWRCKNFRMGHGAADDDTVRKSKYCDKHYNYDKNHNKKKRSRDGEGAGSGPDLEDQLPPDEERCCHTDGRRWRCKKSRMGHGADADDDHSVPKTKYCENHYNHFAEKNVLRNKSTGNGDTDTSVIVAKRKHAERAEGSGELNSFTNTVVETRASKRRKIVTETNNQPATATDDNFDSDIIVQGGSTNNGRKRKYSEKLSGELESLARTRNTTFTDENEQTLADATDRWRKLLSCMQSKGCGESCISNLESLVFRSGKESSILRCVELRNSERVESEVLGLQNDITQNCENPTDESNRSKLNGETSIGGRKGSHMYESKATDKVLNTCDLGVNNHHETDSKIPEYSAMSLSSGTRHLSSEGQNVEEGKGWGSSLKRSSQHGSSSEAHLERSKEPFADLVSHDCGESLRESEDFDCHVNSKNSLGDPMDMLAMKNWNRNNDEMKWKSEPDMLSSFEEDPELFLKAICALYRQEISEDEISPKGLYFDDDTLRCTTLAKFLMDKDCEGDVNKSVKELEMLDFKAFEDCKRLVRRYSIYLFDIYKNGKDPFFLPATTAGPGDQTSR